MTEIQAFFFEGEQTLFLFYELKEGEIQSQDPVLEILVNGLESQTWTDIRHVKNVHTHVAATCPPHERCGSLSLAIPKERQPYFLQFRYRFDRDGDLADETSIPVVNIPNDGTPKSRSAQIYGVFDPLNQYVQWRLYNTFPTLPNERVEALGLRRTFSVAAKEFGTFDSIVPDDNPRLYGVVPACALAASTAWTSEITTANNERARWMSSALPETIDAAKASAVCAVATVATATGNGDVFTAHARKNPQVAPAFGSLKAKVQEAAPLSVLVTACGSDDSDGFLSFQKDRVLLGNPAVTLCLNDASIYTIEKVHDQLNAAAESMKASQSRDIYFKVVLNHGNELESMAIEGILDLAIKRIAVADLVQPSPRVIGAFVYNAAPKVVLDSKTSHETLWCPMVVPEPEPGQTTEFLACQFLPATSADAGPLHFAFLSIFPSRANYVAFKEENPDADLGEIKSLRVFAPLQFPDTYLARLENPRIATFFNGEVLSVGTKEALSFCNNGDGSGSLAFRPVTGTTLPDPAKEPQPNDPTIPRSLSNLPILHNRLGRAQTYHLGLIWDFPFLLELKYQVAVAAGVKMVGGSIPFGLTSKSTEIYGTSAWFTKKWDVGAILARCSQFCDHPAFDSNGTYHVAQTWRREYQTACYVPKIPTARPGVESSPHDP